MSIRAAYFQSGLPDFLGRSPAGLQANCQEFATLRQDRQVESDAYEPDMHDAQVGSKRNFCDYLKQTSREALNSVKKYNINRNTSQL